jgi:transcriptional regulator with XRE-family HTH domain
MSNDDIVEIYLKNQRKLADQPLTSEDIDAFLSTPALAPPGAVERMRARFVEKVLANLHPEPVRHLDKPFGQWLKLTREKARLTQEMIAAVLNKDRAFIEQLEKGTLSLCDIHPDDRVNLLNLFRVHSEAVSELFDSLFPNRRDTSILGFGGVSVNPAAAAQRQARMRFAKCLDEIKSEMKRRQLTHLLD